MLNWKSGKFVKNYAIDNNYYYNSCLVNNKYLILGFEGGYMI